MVNKQIWSIPVPSPHRIVAFCGIFTSLIIFGYCFYLSITWPITDILAWLNLASWYLLGLFVLAIFLLMTIKSIINHTYLRDPFLYFGIARAVFIYFTLACVVLHWFNWGYNAETPMGAYIILSGEIMETLFRYFAGWGIWLFSCSVYLLCCRTYPTFDICYVASIIFTVFSATMFLLFSQKIAMDFWLNH